MKHLCGPIPPKAARLTQRGVRERLKAVGVVLAITPGSHPTEYRVKLREFVGEGYFTTDLQDALDTGLKFARPNGLPADPHAPDPDDADALLAREWMAEDLSDLCEPEGSGELHYSDVLGAMGDCLNVWQIAPQPVQRLHDELFKQLHKARSIALLLEAAVRHYSYKEDGGT